MRIRLLAVFTALLTAAAASQLSCSQLPARAHGSGLTARTRDRVQDQVRLSELIQVPVTSKDGDSLGKIQDFMVNPYTGQIESALVTKGFVVGKGPVMGLGEIVVPVPWKAINLSSERHLVAHVDEQKVQPAPGDEGSSPEQPGYAVHIFGFMHSGPNSDVGGPGEGEVESGQGGGESESTPAVPDKPAHSPREL